MGGSSPSDPPCAAHHATAASLAKGHVVLLLAPPGPPLFPGELFCDDPLLVVFPPLFMSLLARVAAVAVGAVAGELGSEPYPSCARYCAKMARPGVITVAAAGLPMYGALGAPGV